MNTTEFNEINNTTKLGGINKAFFSNPDLTPKQIETLQSSLEEFNSSIASETKAIFRKRELEVKAIVYGLTDAEKEEYKKLKGGE